MQTIDVNHALQSIAIVVAITAAIIGATCAISLKWINGMREDFKGLGEEFREFVRMYYEKHEEVIKKEDCISKHAKLDAKVDAIHSRLDRMVCMATNNIEHDRR